MLSHSSAPTCPVLSAPANGQVDAAVRIFGSVATYSCDAGFTLNGEATRTCGGEGAWSGNAPSCDRELTPHNFVTPLSEAVLPPSAIFCPLLSNPVNGQVVFPSTAVGSMATYSCNSGFSLNGESTRTCGTNGDWSGQEPTCQGPILGFAKKFFDYVCILSSTVVCPPLFSPANGQVFFSSTVEGSVATYSCDSGFVINGEVTRTCGEDGTWSGEAPTCERMF